MIARREIDHLKRAVRATLLALSLGGLRDRLDELTGLLLVLPEGDVGLGNNPDEPAVLDNGQPPNLVAGHELLIRRMRDRGSAILIVSHSLDQVLRLADRICILRRGKQVGIRRTSETTGDEIVAMITGLR